MTRHGIELDSPAIREFCAKWKITRLEVFGSIVREDFRPDSDIDFLATWQDGVGWDAFDHMDMEEELAKILSRKVDLVGRTAIELSRNRLRKHEILSTAEQIVA